MVDIPQGRAEVPRPAVVGDWLCLHPLSTLPEAVCFKCGKSQGITRRPIAARGTRKVGYRTYQTITQHLLMPLCARCDFVRRWSAVLVTLSLVAGWLLVPWLAIVYRDVVGLPVMAIVTLVAPIVGLVMGIRLYRRSSFELGGLDPEGRVEIRWVHPVALAEVSASELDLS